MKKLKHDEGMDRKGEEGYFTNGGQRSLIKKVIIVPRPER